MRQHRKRDVNGRFTSEEVTIIYKNGEKYKECTKCKKEKKIEEFYNARDGRKTSRCKKCTDEINKSNKHKYMDWYKEYWRKHKKEAIEKCRKHYIKKREMWMKIIEEYHPPCCSVCGYKKFFGALEFHHIDPEKKENIISNLMKKAQTDENKKIFTDEIKKCIIVCANCHRELHYMKEKNETD